MRNAGVLAAKQATVTRLSGSASGTCFAGCDRGKDPGDAEIEPVDGDEPADCYLP